MPFIPLTELGNQKKSIAGTGQSDKFIPLPQQPQLGGTFPFKETSSMPRSRTTGEYGPSGAQREYLDTETGKYVPESESTFGQRVRGLTETFVDPAFKAIESAVKAPVDAVRLLPDTFRKFLGKELVGTQPLKDLPGRTLPSGRKSETIQSEFATKTVPAVQSGEISPLAATADVVAQIVSSASDALGVGAVAENVATKVGGKLVSQAIRRTPDQVIAELISPKLTAKEVKLAEVQGRLVKGKGPTLFRAGKPDQVLTSDKVFDATQTIKREIPDAAKLSEQELYTALEARTADMAQKLQPQMRAVKIKPNSLKNEIEMWNQTKAKQLLDADATEELNILKIQKQFDSRFKKILDGESTYDDVWQERIAYDNSVPDNVKKANALSDARLLSKKDMWLENREILNRILTNTESGLDEVVQAIFKDMSNMYNAKANLLSKASVNLEKVPSKIRQWMTKNPFKTAAIGTGIGAGVAGISGFNPRSYLPF